MADNKLTVSVSVLGLSPIDYAKAMCRSVLQSKATDCGDRDGELNHEAEQLNADFFSAHLRQQYGMDIHLRAEDIAVFELCRGLARQIIAMREGRVNWDKVADVAWAVVGADAVKPGALERELGGP